MFRRRLPQPQFIVGQCPPTCLGVLDVWITRRGRPIALCDECESAWFDLTAVREETAIYAKPDDFSLPDGDVIDHPASWDEVLAAGWERYVQNPP